MSKPTFRDLHQGTHKELCKTYKLTDRQLQQQIKRHCQGASRQDQQALFKTVYVKE